MGKYFTPLGNLKTEIHFRSKESITLFFFNLLFDSEVHLPFNKGNAVQLKRNQKSNREKLNLSVTNFKTFSENRLTKNSPRPIKVYSVRSRLLNWILKKCIPKKSTLKRRQSDHLLSDVFSIQQIKHSQLTLGVMNARKHRNTEMI